LQVLFSKSRSSAAFFDGGFSAAARAFSRAGRTGFDAAG